VKLLGALQLRSRRRRILAALGALALAVLAWLLLRPSDPDPVVQTVVAPQTPKAQSVEKPKAKQQRRPGPRLEIPAIGVSARVVSLGLNADRSLEVPTNFATVGWWNGGPKPGEPGPAVLTGHVDSRETGPAVFYKLRELGPGDKVTYIRSDRSVVRFVVQRLEQHPKADFPTADVYGSTRRPVLRLITCGGEFNDATGHYLDNLIAFAHRV
jgi:sortase (surface protein transpeptidase)